MCLCVSNYILCNLFCYYRDPSQEEIGESGLAKKWADDGDEVRNGALQTGGDSSRVAYCTEACSMLVCGTILYSYKGSFANICH